MDAFNEYLNNSGEFNGLPDDGEPEGLLPYDIALRCGVKEELVVNVMAYLIGEKPSRVEEMRVAMDLVVKLMGQIGIFKHNKDAAKLIAKYGKAGNDNKRKAIQQELDDLFSGAVTRSQDGFSSSNADPYGINGAQVKIKLPSPRDPRPPSHKPPEYEAWEAEERHATIEDKRNKRQQRHSQLRAEEESRQAASKIKQSQFNVYRDDPISGTTYDYLESQRRQPQPKPPSKHPEMELAIMLLLPVLVLWALFGAR